MMDYKYIEQLMERYWQCQTTLEEEAILRAFFAQDDIPVHLLPYRQLFLAEHLEQSNVRLDETFDRRMLDIIESERTVKAKTITLSQRLTPLFRAAAVIAMFITLGTAAQRAISTDNEYPAAEAYQSVTVEGPSVAVNDTVKKDTAKLVQAPRLID
jgi:hypothetical protein